MLIIPREVLLDGAAKQRLIAGRGDLIVIWKARGVHIGRASHPEGAGPLRHQLGEIALVATKILGHHHGGIVRRLGDAFNRILNRNLIAAGERDEADGRLAGNAPHARVHPTLC